VGRLVDDETLESSPVVANSAMNRERRLAGYARELGVDVVAFLESRLSRGSVRWLDLCCGQGNGPLECARTLNDPRLRIVGVDLVDFFAGPRRPDVSFEVASVTSWTPRESYDLVTCVHGLHYVGDKLGLLARAASWLVADGLLVANFDAASVRPAGRRVTTALRQAGFEYDGRRRRVTCRGRREPTLPFQYVGADDQVGPNYTGQPAVESYYV